MRYRNCLYIQCCVISFISAVQAGCFRLFFAVNSFVHLDTHNRFPRNRLVLRQLWKAHKKELNNKQWITGKILPLNSLRFPKKKYIRMRSGSVSFCVMLYSLKWLCAKILRFWEKFLMICGRGKVEKICANLFGLSIAIYWQFTLFRKNF